MIPIIARPWPLNLGYWHWWWTSWRVLWGSVARLPSGVDREAIWDRQQNYGSPYPRPLLDSSANQHVDVMAWYGMCSIPYPKSFVVFFKDIQAFEHYILACPFLVSLQSGRRVWRNENCRSFSERWEMGQKLDLLGSLEVRIQYTSTKRSTNLLSCFFVLLLRGILPGKK